jgi:hypothetical protein
VENIRTVLLVRRRGFKRDVYRNDHGLTSSDWPNIALKDVRVEAITLRCGRVNKDHALR